MCGITGIFNITDQNLNLSSVIKLMTDAIRHRGPDDEGYYLYNLYSKKEILAGGDETLANAWENKIKYCPDRKINSVNENYQIAFGHRRLSVIDLSEAGHQPMCTPEKDIWITLNGEIYNYIEIRDELKSKGYSFESNSDTEVLLYAYKEWGENFHSRLNGMWSFVIFDKNKNILLGSRDRFGVKPLYYYIDKNIFAFASEHKALLKIPEIQTNINEKAVFDYLFLNHVEMENEGFFKNIFELQPSHNFIFDFKAKKLSIKKYYQLTFEKRIVSFDKTTQSDNQQKINKLINKAVELRLRSDIPLGFCLSGGIDSSSLVCTASEIVKTKNISKIENYFKVFTAVNNIKNFDESAWAESVVEKTKTEWIKADCYPEDLLNNIQKIIYFQDIPLLSTSTYAQYKVMQAAANNGIHILIDGQGGDELFAGYASFYSSYYYELFANLKFISLINELKSLNVSPTNFKVFIKDVFKNFLDLSLNGNFKVKIAGKIKPEAKYFNKDFLKNHCTNITFSGEHKLIGTNKLLHFYFTNYYLKNLLRWEDRCSMAFSVESRTPFSDDIDLIEFLFKIPSNYKIKNGWSKSLLRNSLKNILPENIAKRTDKMGFTTPQQIWLKEIHFQMKSFISEYQMDNSIVNISCLIKDWDIIFNGNNTKVQDFVWRFYNYLLWKKIFFSN